MFNSRLILAFIFSCLLHAALIFFTYLKSVDKVRPQGDMPLSFTKVRIIRDLQEVIKNDAALVVKEATILNSQYIAPRAKHQTNPASIDSNSAIEDHSLGIRLPLVATTYHTSAELTKKPQVLTNPELDTPDVKPIVATGTLILKLWINEFGDVEQVAIEKTDLPDFIAAEAAGVFRKTQFQPGEINDQRVASIIRIEIRYDDDRLNIP